MSFRSLVSTALLTFSLLPAGCDQGDANLSAEEVEEQALQEEFNRIINPELNLEGEACDWQVVREEVSETGYRMCASGTGIQKCGEDWGEGPTWERCIPQQECTPGASVNTTPEDEICPGTIYCVQLEDVTAWSDVPSCNTPLVLRFDDAPVTYTSFDADASIAAFAAGAQCTNTDWPSASTPWLVFDRDGNGLIEGGEELFGSGTILESGRRATQGFEALTELDENHDGRVDAEDSKFAQLALWSDHDGDRRSQDSEMSSLADAGVSMLSVDFHKDTKCDERGNCGRERASFDMSTDLQSRMGEIVDVYLPCR